MNKYLLCVLLSFTPIPAISATGYIYDLVEGTMRVSDYFAKDQITTTYPMMNGGKGLHMYPVYMHTLNLFPSL